MWLFKKKPVRVAGPATETAGDTGADEHSTWGVGGPGTLPGVLFAEMAEVLTAGQDAAVSTTPNA
jgi:hypothetical protein